MPRKEFRNWYEIIWKKPVTTKTNKPAKTNWRRADCKFSMILLFNRHTRKLAQPARSTRTNERTAFDWSRCTPRQRSVTGARDGGRAGGRAVGRPFCNEHFRLSYLPAVVFIAGSTRYHGCSRWFCRWHLPSTYMSPIRTDNNVNNNKW